MLHEFFIAPFSYEFMQRGLLAAVLLGVSGGLIGVLLVLRRLALMGDAVAHSLLPGVGFAYLAFGPSPLSLFAGALIAGLLASVGSWLVTSLTRVKEEAAFAALFIVFFGGGVALISAAGSQINLAHFLFGNVLGVTIDDLWLGASASTLTVAAFLVLYRSLVLESFDPVFYRATGGRGTWLHFGLLALTVANLVAALQAMGVVLALGLFILPAVSAYLWTDRMGVLLLLSVVSALAGAVAGLLLSFHAGMASGAAIVLVLGSWFLLSAVASPRYGMVTKLLRLAREGRGVLHTPE
ncbi:MAG: metal ABC transporter permease [Opitutaceae bacterium]